MCIYILDSHRRLTAPVSRAKQSLKHCSPPPSDFEVIAAAAHRTMISESEAEQTQPIQPRRAVASNAQPKELDRPIQAV